jgi:hypothetical protein
VFYNAKNSNKKPLFSQSIQDKADECSDSFEFNRHSNRLVHKVGNRKSGSNSIPVSSKLEINPANDESGKVTLVHTVSFYRRQQSQSANNTPVRKILYKNLDDAADEEMQEKNLEDNKKMKEMVDEKIKKLLNEVCKQQTIIAQTSQALNLCASTVEFSGSTEAVEGERHLLVASEYFFTSSFYINIVGSLHCITLIWLFASLIPRN